MNTLAKSESKVLSFMEAVQEQIDLQKEDDEFKKSTDYKLKVIDREKDAAKDICLDSIFASLYKDAVPLGVDYKNANSQDLDTAFKDFMSTRCPNGIEWYIKEAIRNGNPFAKKVLEDVNELVNDHYRDKELNIEDIDADELVFNTNDDVQRKLDIIGQNLAVPEISQAIRDNVKQTALSEITRAKKEKEELKNVEAELAKDINIDTPEKVQEAMELKDIGNPKDYTPSLFNGIMINKLNKITPLYEYGTLQEVNTYDALNEYGSIVHEELDDYPSFASAEELAFIEAVKEYTGLSVLKALKLESFNKYRINDLAQEYAQG